MNKKKKRKRKEMWKYGAKEEDLTYIKLEFQKEITEAIFVIG